MISDFIIDSLLPLILIFFKDENCAVVNGHDLELNFENTQNALFKWHLEFN